MDLAGIFEIKSTGEYYWVDFLDEDEIKETIKETKYFVDCDYASQFRYMDEIQNGEELRDDELYVVTYYTGKHGGLYHLVHLVDFGITKQEIIDNVKANKYVEGANYYTIGQMLYTTRMIVEEMSEEGN